MAVSYKKLWKLLIDKDMKMKELEEQAKVSHYTVSKMYRGENVTIDILERICKTLDCSLDDIVEFVPDEKKQISPAEKAEESFDQEEAEKLTKQLAKKEFDLNDYLLQLRQVKKMGSFSSILKMIPGMANIKDLKVDEKEFSRIEAIICSMTDKERKNPKLLNGSRRIRIANGSGTSVQEINKFMKSFEMTQKMMKQMKDKKSLKKMMKEMNLNQ